MITWMQRHRKYLVVTIWISTIAFIGAGFVGWGQYNYGDKAGAVAKVGDISITAEELQKSYSTLFNQYNQLFGGKLDEKQAQQFGLQRQALRQLVNQALILNLADHYGLRVSDEELWNIIKSQNAFHKNGSFDKTVYAELLKQNRLTIQEYESSMKKELLIQKTLYLISPAHHPFEVDALSKAMGVADKINYKILTPAMISPTIDEKALKAFWEKNQKEFVTEPSYTIEYISQSPLSSNPTPQDIQEYYETNRQSLKGINGQLLSLDQAKPMIIAALNDKKTEKEALRLYIDYKKGTLPTNIQAKQVSISAGASVFDPVLTKEIMSLNANKAFLKPRKFGNEYIIVKLIKADPSRQMTFDEAKTTVSKLYANEVKKNKLQSLAQETYKTFSGTTTDFITRNDSAKLGTLTPQEGAEFLNKLFSSKQKQGYITLESGNVILYNVLEQKLLQDSTLADGNAVAKIKGDLLDQGLLKSLEAKYPIEIYVEGI